MFERKQNLTAAKDKTRKVNEKGKKKNEMEKACKRVIS